MTIMAVSERTSVLFSPEQRARLDREAARRGISIGSLVREAVDAYVAPPRRTKAEALADLLSIGAPVANWEQMEEEILRGAIG